MVKYAPRKVYIRELENKEVPQCHLRLFATI